MDKPTIETYADLENLLGKELGASDYVRLTQDKINMFAEVTNDKQWIHVNPEKAKTDSPFNSTIAHGYMTLSMIPSLLHQIADFSRIRMTVNYEIEKMRFIQPVLANDEIRLKAKLVDLKNLRGIAKTKIQISLEIKSTGKQALRGYITFVYYFD